MVLLWFSSAQLNFQLSSPVNNNDFILKTQVVRRAVGLLESDGKKVDVKIMFTAFAALWKILFVSHIYAQG